MTRLTGIVNLPSPALFSAAGDRRRPARGTQRRGQGADPRHRRGPPRKQLGRQTPEELPHLASWREACRAFGAKPRHTRPSVGALLRRVDPAGLPRIHRITDVYNAVSIAHLLPLGGEDPTAYVGSARLVCAEGAEPFDTAGGEPAVEHPKSGEVVRRDDAGVTCRRWNRRQCTRPRITTGTTSGLLMLHVLDPLTDDDANAGADSLTDTPVALDSDATVHRRLFGRAHGGAPC